MISSTLNWIHIMTKNILVTDRCKTLVISGNKLFSRRMDLHFCRKDSYHLLINESCRRIKEKACCCCINLRSLKFPDSLIEIENYAFKGCKKLMNIEFGKDSQLKFIGYKAFSETDLRVLYFPRSLCSIRSRAFYYCQRLRRVVFPEISSMKTLDLNSFNGNDISIEIPRNVYLCNCSQQPKLYIGLSPTNKSKNILSFV